VRKHLVKLLGDDYPLNVIEVNTFTCSLTSFKNGIRMVPARKCGQDVLSGLTLSHDAAAGFQERKSLAASNKSTEA